MIGVRREERGWAGIRGLTIDGVAVEFGCCELLFPAGLSPAFF